jgi:hypothetical protein
MTLSVDVSGRTYSLEADQARNAVGAVSAALGALAVVAPLRTAAAFGVRDRTAAGALLVRMIGVRNATMGLRTLQATGAEQRAAVQAGLVVGVVDSAALLVAARRGVVSRRAAAVGLLVLGLIAGAGYAATLED